MSDRLYLLLQCKIKFRGIRIFLIVAKIAFDSAVGKCFYDQEMAK